MADFRRRRVERRAASWASMAALSSCARRSSGVLGLWGVLRVPQRATALRRFFVFSPPHRFVEGVFEFFPGGERAFGPDFLEPRFQGMNFAALLQQILARMLPVKIPD